MVGLVSKLIKLHLINYINHSDLTINLVDGVNIIGGPSGSGKSAIRCSLDDLYFNEDIKNSIKEGTKKSQIIATFDDGTEIEKVRSATINRYILRKPNQEKQVFDKIGKDVPQEIKEVVGLDYYECDGEKLNLHIAPQITLPFLLEQSPTFRMKLFNQLTGNSNIDELLSSYNKDIFNLNREIPVNEKELEDKNADLNEKVVQLQEVDEKLSNLEKIYAIIQAKYQQYEQLLSNYNKIKELKEKREFLQYKLLQNKIPQLYDGQLLREKIEKLDKLKTLLNALESTKKKIDTSATILQNQCLPCLNVQEIQGKIGAYTTLKTIFNQIQEITTKITKNKQNVQLIKQEIDTNQKNYEELKTKFPICDNCGQYILNGEEHEN